MIKDELDALCDKRHPNKSLIARFLAFILNLFVNPPQGVFMGYFICLLGSFFIAQITFAKQVPLDHKNSSIEWSGKKKFTGDSHNGTIQIKKGTVNLDDANMLVGGTIILDMTMINDMDLSGSYKKKLEDHLKSADFFDVANYRDASFKITKVTATRSNSHQVTGNMTIRGTTHPETFELIIEKKGKKMIARGDIEINRTKYNVSYNQEANLLNKAISIAKDKIIEDKINLTLNLQTQSI